MSGATFYQELKQRSRQELDLCYQCGKCSAGCPTASWMDLTPHAMLRLLQMGGEEEVMRSHALWLCVACGTCGTRCPNGIDIGLMLDGLREMAMERKVHAAEKNIHLLHEAFVRSIRRGGKIHEATMLIDYKLRSLDLFTDLGAGLRMFLKGKIPLLPERVAGRREIARIFERCRKP